MKIISIEGNIGSGKSTFVNILKEKFKNEKHIIFLDEPVDEWKTIQDFNNENIIEKFYKDQEKYSFSFQIMALITRIEKLTDVIRNYKEIEFEMKKELIIITERSIDTDANVFAKMLYNDGKIEPCEFQIYQKCRHIFDKNFQTNIDYFIYLSIDPEKAKKRILKRNRKGEENIPVEYLMRCMEYHEEWMSCIKNNIILDSNIEFTKKENKDKLNDMINKVIELI